MILKRGSGTMISFRNESLEMKKKLQVMGKDSPAERSGKFQ